MICPQSNIAITRRSRIVGNRRITVGQCCERSEDIELDIVIVSFPTFNFSKEQRETCKTRHQGAASSSSWLLKSTLRSYTRPKTFAWYVDDPRSVKARRATKTNARPQESRTISPPAAEEVQIHIASTGLCGSDLHYYTHFRNGDILVREPLSLGHESAGIVTSVGSSVSNLQAGDKVALEVGLPCEQCQRCEQGRYNICKDVKFRSSGKSFPHFQGTLQERVNHPAKWVYKLPEEMSLDVGALLEPLGVALHAFRRSLMPEGASVVVFGAGAVGLLCAAVAKLRGAGKVIIADIDAGRLDFAVQNGFAHASYLVPMRRGKDIDESLQIAKETAAEVGKVDGVGEVDVVFECTGVPSCVQAGIYVSRYQQGQDLKLTFCHRQQDQAAASCS